MTAESAAPSAAVVLPPSRNQAIFRASIGAALLAAGIGNQVASAGFPYNAPVEWFWNLFITVTLCGSGIALLLLALRAARRPSVATVVGRFSPLVVAGATLVGLTLVVWLLTGVPALAEPGRLRYMNLTFGLAWAGSLWGTGMVLSAAGFRAWNKSSRIVACIALAVGLLLAAFAIWVAVLYSAGLTD